MHLKMTFLETTEHFSGKKGALRWPILVEKQKDNVQNAYSKHNKTDTEIQTKQSCLSHVILTCKMRVNRE